MATPFPPSRQALELADRLIDGQLTDVELQRLNRQLESNPALRHYLLDMCQFHALLTFDTRAKRLIDEVVATHGTERSLETVPPGEAVVSASSVPRTWPRFGFFSRGATGAVAAALLVALSTLVTLQLMQPHVDRGPIVATNDGASQSLPEVTAIKIGPQTTELELARIGSVILEGPTDFELVGPMRARLTKGKIRFRVTDKRGRGFVVDTPYGEITDLGTEFGVDVQEQEPTSLVVFDGEVDLRVKHPELSGQAERLVGGEGVVFDSAGQVDRIMSIFTNKDGTFTRQGAAADPNRSVIASVHDNLRPSETRNYYEIVPKGLYEDSLAYVDRPHEWNGVDERGMPPYLLGADYIKPFNDDKQQFDFRLEVTLAAPAQMYLFFDDRIAPPAWLLEEFEDTGDDIGIDIGPAAGLGKGPRIGYGPGQWVDLAVSVWRRKVTTPGIVVLGPNSGSTANSAMYGICAIAIDQ